MATYDNNILSTCGTDFMALKVTAPEAEALANCIMAEHEKHAVVIANMNKLKMEDRLDIFEGIYGKEVWQHFSQK